MYYILQAGVEVVSARKDLMGKLCGDVGTITRAQG